MMPGVDGLEVCRQLKGDPGMARIPIIMLTAKGEEVDKIVGLELGADDYVVKPFSPRELVLRIKAILRRYGAPEPNAPKLWERGRPQDRLRSAPDRNRRRTGLPHRPPSSSCSPCSSPGRARSRPATTSWIPSGIPTSRATPEPWIPTSADCGKNSAPTPPGSKPSEAWATASRPDRPTAAHRPARALLRSFHRSGVLLEDERP